MISYDVIGDYMSDLDDVRKRIEKRKRPLNDHNFKKLYNGMVRLMVMMIVVLGSLIVLKNPELEQKIFNQKYLQQLITFVSQSVLDFLPEDVKVSQELQYTLIKDDYYKGTGNQVLAMNNGKVIDVKKQQVTILDENGTEITFSKLKDIQVKKFQKIKQGDTIALYQQKFKMIFEYLGKQITYQEFWGCKMKIHPLTYLYLLLAFISGSSYYVAFLFFSILHEIGHYLVALYFSFEIEKIMILPFGAFLSLKDLGKHYVYEEIGMLLCGPFINFICFIFFLFIKEPLLAKINIYILIFNLLPVYPLDGSKLLLLFLSYFIDYQKAMQIQIKVSLLFICILWIITKQIGRKIILGYLFYQVILKL